jgi:hypothetical protein
MNQQLVIADLRQRLFEDIQTSSKNLSLPKALAVSPWVAMSLCRKLFDGVRPSGPCSQRQHCSSSRLRRLWRRLAVIAFEDIGQGDMTAVGHALAATGSKLLRAQLGGDERVATFVIHSMCEAAKCRAADDLAVVCDWKPELEECRVNYVEYPTTELMGIVADKTQPLPNRAIALCYVFGTDRLRPGSSQSQR